MVYLEVDNFCGTCISFLHNIQYFMCTALFVIALIPTLHCGGMCVDKISLNIPPLFYAQQGPQKRLPLISYLLLGDILKQQEVGRLTSIGL